MSTTEKSAPQARPGPVDEQEARQVAEAARETEWVKPSFVRELFLGNFRLDLIHPYPEQAPEDAAKTDAYLARLRSMLKPGGRLTVSIIHPTVYAVVYPEADYFALTQYSEDYDYGEETVWMTYWHRPLQDVINTFIEAGFRITRVTEPPPAGDTPAELLPNQDGRSFICFLFVELEAR